MAEQFVDALGVRRDEVQRLPAAPIDAVLAASKRVFDDVPRRTPGTLAFAPIIDGDIVPAHPVKLAREGRTHPVPLIIGTNKHEAALFRWMKSPLMPITPQAIRAMFTEIAAEQPALQLPSEAQIRTAYRGRAKTIGMGVARDIGFRMPSIWFAEGHRDVAPVYLYRFDFATPDVAPAAAGRRARHRVALRVGQSRCRTQGPDVQTGRAQGGQDRVGAAAHALAELRGRRRAVGARRGIRPGGRTARTTARRCMIDAQDRVIDDLDHDLRTAWGDEVLSFR